MARCLQMAICLQSEPSSYPVTAATHWDNGKRYVYVRDVPRKIRTAEGKYIAKPGFADWEYTDNPSQAIHLSRYWFRRFRADRDYCNQCWHYSEV
jgi:hypothetical protein